MYYHTDYSETEEALSRVMEALDRAQNATANANLSPKMPIAGARAQVDALERAIHEALFELDDARAACIAAGRRHLRLCK
ncbi:MAG: hypothetical protein AAGE80_16075 [Pseudomonadota bacterium]